MTDREPRVTVVDGWRPGVVGRVVELHASYYAPLFGFGAYFESRVARDLGEYVDRYDPDRDRLRTLWQGGRVEGSIAIDGRDAAGAGAHLRWFLVDESLRGHGYGARLLADAIEFCRARGYPRTYLWTVDGLPAARHLYEKAGFRLAETLTAGHHGREMVEMRFDLDLGNPGTPA